MKSHLFIVLWSVWMTLTASAQRPPLPNIVLFIADDLGVRDIQPYGNRMVRTPHLQQLRSESLLFTHAFASSPTCGPSRSSLFTGLLPMRHGAHGNHSGVNNGTLSVVQHMEKLGYRVAIAGKLHVGPQDVFPFEHIAGTNVREPGYEKKPGLFHDLELGPVDTWLRKQQSDKPFVLIVADHSPHVVWPAKATYRTDEVDIPAVHIDTEKTRRARARYYTDVTKMDANVGKILALIDKHRMKNNTLFLFTADQGPQWAFGKWGLYDYGVQVPLLMRWPGHIPPQTTSAALVSQVDILPTMIEMAGGQHPGGMDGRSFLPVLTDPARRHRDTIFASHTGDHQMNRSPMRMLRTDQYKYILNLAPEIPYTTHMDKAADHDGGREYWSSWRTESFSNPHAANVLWRYHNRPPEELYDIRTDPDEQKNLTADPTYATVLEAFRIRMREQRKQQGDDKTGPETETDTPRPKGQPPVAPYIF